MIIIIIIMKLSPMSMKLNCPQALFVQAPLNMTLKFSLVLFLQVLLHMKLEIPLIQHFHLVVNTKMLEVSLTIKSLARCIPAPKNDSGYILQIIRKNTSNQFSSYVSKKHHVGFFVDVKLFLLIGKVGWFDV